MYQAQSVSLKLSEVMSKLGVNERMLLKRRRVIFLREAIENISDKISGHETSEYIFGSQVEGSTTLGLKSDLDTLHCFSDINMIQDWSEWQPGKETLLMIQDETTSPGYCLLQVLRSDEPLPCFCTKHRSHVDFFVDRRGRTLAKLSSINRRYMNGYCRNGPAYTCEHGCVDMVFAFRCKSWPKEAHPWLIQHSIGGWPTNEMKKFCETTGCFVVPVGSKRGGNEEVEWRISTSQAERCLMLSLNITQIRCYILMKMILKTFIKPQCGGVLSSYICKTVLFHLIQNTYSNQWQEHNLLACLKHCLIVLQHCVREKNCPHFIIPKNNLMAGRISSLVQQQLLAILEPIIQCEVRAIIYIPIDDLGKRLQEKMNMIPVYPCGHYYHSSADMSVETSADIMFCLFRLLSGLLGKVYNEERQLASSEKVTFLHLYSMSSLTKIYSTAELNTLEKAACRLVIPIFCLSLGSVMASTDIRAGNSISSMAFAWFSAGLNSDMSSSRLKLASALYCVGEMEKTKYILRNIEEKYDMDVVHSVCGCYCHDTSLIRAFGNKCITGTEELIKDIGFCVKFMRCEINCVPQELQYEMFRSTQEELLERDKNDEKWMNLAVVDSLPYLYFLQYKTNRNLQRAIDQQQALSNLITTIVTDETLSHRETALNLLGQCMELENRYDDALRCYINSVKVRARNNAARVHICKLLSARSLGLH